MYHENDIAPIASYTFQFKTFNDNIIFAEKQRFVNMVFDPIENSCNAVIEHLAEVAEILLESQEEIVETSYVMKSESGNFITHTFVTYDGRKGYLSAARKS